MSKAYIISSYAYFSNKTTYYIARNIDELVCYTALCLFGLREYWGVSVEKKFSDKNIKKFSEMKFKNITEYNKYIKQKFGNYKIYKVINLKTTDKIKSEIKKILNENIIRDIIE